MATKPVYSPGPEHPITIEANPLRIEVSVEDKVVADTQDALRLQEASYPPVQYIPRRDVDMTLLRRSEHQSYCPYKGDCTYFDIMTGDAPLVNAVWSYEEPFSAVAAIKDHLAFYSDRGAQIVAH